MRPSRSLVILPLLVASTAVLAGCSGGGTTTQPTATETVTAPPPTASDTPTSSDPTPSSTPSSSGSTPSAGAATPTCGSSDVRAVTAAAAARLPSPAGLEGVRWDPTYAITSAYDPCAALSAVVLPIESATGSSPVAILLFHDGRYLGTATKEQYGFVPSVTRASDSRIAVTYRYAKPDETTAENSGRTHATFTWDDSADRVVMQGQVPPVG